MPYALYNRSYPLSSGRLKSCKAKEILYKRVENRMECNKLKRYLEYEH